MIRGMSISCHRWSRFSLGRGEWPAKLLAALLLAASARGQTEPSSGVADDAVLQGKGPQMMKDFLLRKVKRQAARPLPESKEALEAIKAAQKKELMRCLGLDPLPPRTPLNGKVTGVFQREGYRLENILFDSRPGFPVTGHLYVPDGPAGRRYPVILNPHGHWHCKKMEPVVQSRLISQALSGYLAFIIDSPGWSWDKDKPTERGYAGCHWDFPLVEGSANVTAVYVWDLMRALDYLESRPEADMSRVGLTGASGGGLAALWDFAADERITCAVPVVYASSLEVNPDNGCACNHVPGALQLGDRSDVLAIRAPAPVYIIGARNDGEFPPAGMKLTGEKLKKIWGLYGAGDQTGWEIFRGAARLQQAHARAGHGLFRQVSPPEGRRRARARTRAQDRRPGGPALPGPAASAGGFEDDAGHRARKPGRCQAAAPSRMWCASTAACRRALRSNGRSSPPPRGNPPSLSNRRRD